MTGVQRPGVLHEVLLIGGRSGVGKTSVAHEVSELLQAAGTAHCLIDGDGLSAAHPKDPADPLGTELTEANLAALWANFTAIGHHRLLYVNTVAVLEAPMILRAMSGGRARGVLLTATDATTDQRLRSREIGSALTRHLQRSATTAVHLQAQAEDWVVRIPTDDRTVGQVAADVVDVCGWSSPR